MFNSRTQSSAVHVINVIIDGLLGVFCVFLFHTAYVLYYCEHGGVDLMGLKSNP